MMRAILGGCIGRILFIIFALVFLAVYISYHGPVV